MALNRSIRKKLGDLREILLELAQQTQPSEGARRAVSGFADTTRTEIERMPQLSLVRPAAIALHNLVTSLQRAQRIDAITDEIEAALEAIDDLLAESTFGYSPIDLEREASAQLRERGVVRCSSCHQPEREVRIVSIPVRPFPAEATRRPSEQPMAMLVCKGCGRVDLHDLRALGVI